MRWTRFDKAPGGSRMRDAHRYPRTRGVARLGLVSMVAFVVGCAGESDETALPSDGTADMGSVDAGHEPLFAPSPQAEATTALAQLEPLSGGDVKGTAVFLKTGDGISLVVALTDCPDGAHPVHIHGGASCADEAAQGGHWDAPRGEGIPTVTCAEGRGTAMTVRHASDISQAWTLNNAPKTGVVGHVIVVHDGGASAARIACGPIAVR